MVKRRFLWVSLFALLSLFISAELFAQADVIEKRQKLMKSNAAATKAIKGAAEQKDYVTIETKVKDILGNMDQVLDLFPREAPREKPRPKLRSGINGMSSARIPVR